jgi:ATP/maltotriose-dependent transcriptional regulator MalT
MVLLEHAAGIGRFTRDPYVMSCQTKSMLCLPLQFQNQLTAVLYLENNLATGAFTADRLEMLRLLAAQTVFLLKLFPQDDEPTVQAEPPLVVEEPEAAPAEGGSPELMDPLTNRELEVLQLMSLGMSNQEIAHQLHIALGTVKLHTNRIFSKMNVNRRAKAVLEGKRMNLLNDPKP